MKYIKGTIARRIIFTYLWLALLVAIVSIGSVFAVNYIKDETIIGAHQHQNMALLSARIRTETLILTNNVQTHVIESGDKRERDAINEQLALLDNLLKQAADRVNHDDVDESLALGNIRQNLILFNVQSKYVLNTYDKEGMFGTQTKKQLGILTQKQQPILLAALEAFARFEQDNANASFMEAERHISQIGFLLSLLSIVVLMTAILIIFVVIRKFAMPLATLTESVRRLPANSLDAPPVININTNDEMGELATALNSMAKEIAVSRHQLEQHASILEAHVEERTRDLQAANEQLSKLSIMVEQSPASIVITDLKGVIEYVNPAFTDISGYTLKEALGHKISMLKSDVTPLKTYQELWTTITAGGVWRGEMRNRRKNSELYWEATMIAPIYNAEKVITHYVSVKEDITARKRAEEALQENELRYRAVAQSANDPVISADSRGLIIGWNRSAESTFGYSEAEAHGRPLTILMPDRFRDAHQAGMVRMLRGGDKRIIGKTVELYGLHRNGSEFPMEMSLAEWQVGGYKFYTAIIRDITERKRAENQLHHAKEEIERANAELETALVREKQLARTDALTGIHNRRYLFELAEHAFDVAVRYQQPLSVIMFDIDHFKKVNDTFGHAAGDSVLQKIAQVVCAEIRTTDVIGRYGGEEFVVILPVTNAQRAYQLGERIREIVAETHTTTPKGDITVTLSIGVAEILYDGVESVDSLIGRADEALYAAKQAGRNRTVIAE